MKLSIFHVYRPVTLPLLWNTYSSCLPSFLSGVSFSLTNLYSLYTLDSTLWCVPKSFSQSEPWGAHVHVCMFSLSFTYVEFIILIRLHPFFLYGLHFISGLALKILLLWGRCLPIFVLKVLQLCLAVYVFNPLGIDFCTYHEVGNSNSISPIWITHVPQHWIISPSYPYWSIISPLSYVQWHCLCDLFHLLFPVVFNLLIFLFLPRYQTVHSCTEDIILNSKNFPYMLFMQ